MDGIFGLGPLHSRCTIARNEEKLHHRDAHHIPPRLSRTRSLPLEEYGGSPPRPFEELHRRELLALGLFIAAHAGSAEAGQSNSQLADAYYNRTSVMLGQIKKVLLGTDVTADDNLGALESFKKDANAYVADYRRLVSPGQKSFAEVYGVITAMTGHFTSFGIGKKGFPAKLVEKQEKRIELAERLLERELVRERRNTALVPGGGDAARVA